MVLILRPKDLRTEVKQAIRKNKNVDGYPNVYYVNNSLVAKRGKTNERTIDEYNIGNYLFENRIHVPKMHSLIELDLAWLKFRHHSNLALLMQRILGEKVCLLEGDQYKKARILFEEELEKVSKLDLITEDTGTHNAIFNPNDGKVYLVDFEYWARRNGQD